MSWNLPPSGNNPHQNEWSEEDRENLGGQSSEEEDTSDNYHRRQRYPEQSASASPSTHHPHIQQHPLHPQQHHPQHQQHHPHHSRQSPPPPPPPPPPQSHQGNEHNPDQNMSYAEMYPYRIPPHQLVAGFQQPAPRQRTAIACRYCRRRKIRCSGFESSPDGRCANCLRFNQECVFTPVSSQTQAFVPAHAAFGRGAPGRASSQILYGAHGQPLPANYNCLPPPPPPPSIDFHSQQQYQRPPSPGGSNRHAPPPAYNHQYDERMVIHDTAERNRSLELHPPLLPPPVSGNPGQSHSHPRRGSAGDYPNRYGRNDPPSPSSHLVPPHPAYSPPPPATGPPPAYQGQSYSQGPPPSIPGNYYPQAQSSGSNSSQQRPRSPVGYHSPGDRSSGSPHPFHPPMQYPPRPTSSGPNPSNPSNHPIPSMQMSNLIDPGPQSQITNRNNQRSAADGDMLDKLRPRTHAWDPRHKAANSTG